MTELLARDLTLGTRVMGATLRLGGGELVAIVGPNGSGKSSLLRLLAGQLRPDGGQALIDGTSVAAMRPIERARAVGYLPQRADIAWPITVADMVALGRHAFGGAGRRSDDETARIHAALDEVGAAELAARSTATLSGGELALCALARVLVAQTPLLLLDEPTAALDPARQMTVMAALRDRARAGTGIAAVLHDLNLAGQFADRIVWMAKGRIAAETGATDANIDRQCRTVFGVVPAITLGRDGRIAGVAVARSGDVIEEPAIGGGDSVA